MKYISQRFGIAFHEHTQQQTYIQTSQTQNKNKNKTLIKMDEYNNEVQQNVEDNLYIQRRRADALGVDEEENEFEENEHVGDEDGMPFLIDLMEFPAMQHVVEPEPFPRYIDIAEEENDLLKDPNCSWGMLPISKGWTEDENLKQIRWSFPSDEMKMTELAFAKHYNAMNIFFHGDWELSPEYKNQQRAFFETFKNCNCCDRHNERFPQFGIARGLRINDTSLRWEHVGKGKSNTCVCACRHNARMISDRVQFEAGNW